MSKETELTVELIAILENFKNTHAALAERIEQDHDYPLWIQGIEDISEARQALINIVMSWSYDSDDKKPGQTSQDNGLVPCSQLTLLAVEKVNDCRLALQKHLIKMDRWKSDDHILAVNDEHSDDDEEELDDAGNASHGDNRLSKRVLHRLGYPRFNRRQACRQLVALPYPVLSAGFFWNRYRKTIKLNRHQVRQQLDRLAQRAQYASAIQNELQRLDAINDNFLVRVYDESVHRRVNLYIEKDGIEQRIQRYAHTPIFYLATPFTPLPEKTLLPAEAGAKGSRLLRRNITIEREPYLCTLNLHRLTAQHR